MNVPGRSLRRTFAAIALSSFAMTAGGCGADSNEKEFLQSAPAGKPSEFPDEKVSARRERLRGKEVGKKGRSKEATSTPDTKKPAS